MQRARRYWSVPFLALAGAFFTGSLAGGEPEKESIFAAVRSAIAQGQVQKTALVGFTLTKNTFEELPGEGALLVGFDLGLGKFTNTEVIYALRPVYRTADGEVSSEEQGLFSNQPPLGKKSQKNKVLRTVQLRAPAGYAVAGATLRADLNIKGLSLIYMRINGTTLDSNQAYASEWVGDQSNGREITIGGDGAPVVGVFGNKDEVRVSALGLIYLSTGSPAIQPSSPSPAQSSSNALSGRKAKRGARSQPATTEPPWKQLELPESAQAPPPRPADEPPTHHPRETYRDTEHHFSFDIPQRWGKMSRTELDKIDEVLRQRGLTQVRYETGFRPLGSALGSYPYILLQVQSLKTAGVSYAEIQRTLNLGLDGPMKTVQGAFSDIVRGAPTGTAVLDRDRDRIIIRLQMDVGYLGKIDGVSVSHLGSDAVVSLHSYATQSTFASNLPVFTDMDTSFEFDDGYRFVPTKDINITGSLLPILTFMGVAVPLGAVFLALGAWKRRAGVTGQ
jgi:hypothetical protein